MRYYPNANKWASHTRVPREPLFFERTGEKQRPPKRDEWYLSGAIPEAWRALRDMTTPYYIVRPVATPPSQITVNGFLYTLTGTAR